MENNEDEPDDIKKATPVEDAVSDGTRDEKKQGIKGTQPKSAPTTLNDRQHSRGRRCHLFGEKFPPPQTKTKKSCHPKAEIICRDTLSKDEYIEMLSTPKKERGLSCKEKASFSRQMSQRLEQLSKPKPSRVMNLLETWGSRLRPEIIEGVQKSLEESCAMSPEQMEAYYNEKRAEDCGRVHRVRRKKCPAGKEKKKSICDDGMDREAVCEEYEMAQRFMRHIISHLKNGQCATEDHYDLTEVILSQLGSVLDYRPSGDGDRKFQMMFMLADGIACWVHGLNLAAAEKLAKQRAKDAQEAIETEESEDEDVKEELEGVTDATEEEDEDEDKAEEAEKEESKDDDEEDQRDEAVEDTEISPDLDLTDDNENDSNPLKDEPDEQDTTVNFDDDYTNVQVKIEPEDPAEETEGEEETVKPGDGTEASEVDENIEDGVRIKEEIKSEEGESDTGEIEDMEGMEDKEDVKDVKMEGKESSEHKASTLIEPGLAIQGLGEGDLFASEIPFITFGKIMEIVAQFLNKFEEAETTEVRRRLQNAILSKLTKLVLAEAPDALDNNMKAVLEVLAENIAVFMENALPKSKVNDIETMAPEIESTEVRNWGHWLETVMDNATNWGKWIHEKVGEAEEKARTKVSRGDWQDWTNSVNSDALRWRMFNLDTRHQMHHADLNLTHKKVVHRGKARTGSGRGATLAPYQEKDETEMNTYEFADEAESHD